MVEFMSMEIFYKYIIDYSHVENNAETKMSQDRKI